MADKNEIPWERVNFVHCPGTESWYLVSDEETRKGRDHVAWPGRKWFLVGDNGLRYPLPENMNDCLNEAYESGVSDCKRNLRMAFGLNP